MAFAIKTHSMPGLSSYHDCKMYFERTPRPLVRYGVDLRWAENERPLDDNKMHHKRIVKRGANFELWLYETCMLTYHVDGLVSVNMGNSTMSSQAFVHRLAPPGVGVKATQGHYALMITNADSETEWLLDDREQTVITLESTGQIGRWRPVTGAVQRQREFADKAKVAEVDAQYHELFMWLRSTAKLLGVSLITDPPAFIVSTVAAMHEDPDTRQHLLSVRTDPHKLRAGLHRHHGAYVARDIPNTLKPKAGRSHALS